MTDVSAALGVHQIKKLDAFIDIRRKSAKIYDDESGKLGEIVTPYEEPNVKHTYSLYRARVSAKSG